MTRASNKCYFNGRAIAHQSARKCHKGGSPVCAHTLQMLRVRQACLAKQANVLANVIKVLEKKFKL